MTSGADARGSDADPRRSGGGAPKPRGAELLRAVEVMATLRAPAGDAWTAQQTHRSLARYLLEESFEVLDAIEADPASGTAGDRHDGAGDGPADGDGPSDGTADPKLPPLVGELGDLLFQILFHARLGQEETPAWDIDDVARAYVQKMERRNPHIFGDHPGDALDDPQDVQAIIAQWHAMKAAEKAAERAAESTTADARSGADEPTGPDWFDSIPQRLPALQTALKAVHRARSDGGLDQLRAAADAVCADAGPDDPDLPLARELLDLVVRAESRDHDPESALRTLLRRTEGRLATSCGVQPGSD